MFFRNFAVLALCGVVLSACASRPSNSLYLNNGFKFYPKDKDIRALDCHQLGEQLGIVYAISAGVEGRIDILKKKNPIDQKEIREEQKQLVFIVKVHDKTRKEHLKRCGELPASYADFKRKNPVRAIR